MKLSPTQIRVLRALDEPEESDGTIPGLRLSTLDRLERLGLVDTFGADEDNAVRITQSGRDYLASLEG